MLGVILPEAFADIIACGDAEDVFHRLCFGNLATGLADYNHQFGLEMYVNRISRQHDCLALTDQAGGTFKKGLDDLKLRGNRVLTQVTSIVAGQGQHLCWLCGRQELDLTHRIGLGGWLKVAEEVPIELSDVVPFDQTVSGGIRCAA